MPKTKISDYSSTASNNTDVDGINIAEGMAPSNVNNAMREIMAHLKDWQAGNVAQDMKVDGAFTCTGAAVLSSTLNINGGVGIGTTPPSQGVTIYNSTSSIASLEGDSTTQSRITRFSNDISGPILQIRKARGTRSLPSAVTSADSIGSVNFQAFGGTNYRGIAQVSAGAETYTADDNISGALIFDTRPTGVAASLTERMRITAAGNVGIGTLTPTTRLDVSGGAKLGASTSDTVTLSALLSAGGGTGTSGQFLKSRGTSDTPVWDNTITSETAKSATGTSVDFTGIPSWVKRITVMFNAVSTSGTSNPQIQLGDAGGIETTGYTVSSLESTTTNYTTGFGIRFASATASLNGSLVLTNVNGNIWAGTGLFNNTSTAVAILAGSKTLSDVLTQIRITTVNGTDTFDAGTINILYE